jgi:hypothetical protein
MNPFLTVISSFILNPIVPESVPIGTNYLGPSGNDLIQFGANVYRFQIEPIMVHSKNYLQTAAYSYQSGSAGRTEDRTQIGLT